MEKFLFIGLGNIGQEYIHTRHNIGFDVLDFWVKKQDSFWTINKLATVAYCNIKGKRIIAIKPNTYMNLSGKAVKYYKEKENIPLGNMIVVVDDLNIPLGEIKLRMSGGSGGHNGLKSIEESLQTKQYPRLRCGIGNVYPKGRQVDFVLGKWKTDEKKIVDKMIIQTFDFLGQIIFMGVTRAMNIINSPQSFG